MLPLFCRITLVFALCLATNITIAQTLETPVSDRNEQLNTVQAVLDAKLTERKTLREQMATATPDDLPELEAQLKEINTDLDEIRSSFEQIAIGNVDLSIFSEESNTFDWRSEMIEVMMPIIRNLQSITEKPRKIEALRSQIQANNEQLAATNNAIASIEERLEQANSEDTIESLTNLQASWRERALDLGRSTDIANVRLSNLTESDGNFFQSIKNGLINFVTGRGLTIVIATLAALGVWFASKLVTNLLTKRASGEAQKTYRTRQRLVRYAFSFLTAVLMTIAVIVVFYVRGDVLLLGLSLLIAGAILLGLRHTVPKFIAEARLLLNLGSIREDERVVYNGLPYRVAALNMYSVLKNPELTGVVRLPLESMMGMISRPAGNEIWFPASKGDYIMLADGKLLEVLELTTELVHLQNLAGTKTSVPAADFYNLTFDNLTRGENFSITGTFGVGYSHQSISNDSIPILLQEAVSERLAKSPVAEHVVSVAVELKEAGASSLDYWVCVTMSSAAVRSYFKISRIIQQTCVDTCTEQNWDIPFPQLTIHNQ